MKTIALAILTTCLVAFAADAPKPKSETAVPVLTADDREPLHEAQEMQQQDQQAVLLGQAAALRLTDRKKTVDAAAAQLQKKCGAYGLALNEAGKVDCGKTKQAEPEKSEAKK